MFAEGNIEGQGFVIPPNSKVEQIIYECHLTTLLQNLESFRPNFLCRSLSTFHVSPTAFLVALSVEFEFLSRRSC